jgi:KTSC domain-containing protein
MELINVDSSMISAIGYDAQQQVLEVVFKRTGTYRYHNVPEDVYRKLLGADSKGSYMRDLIVDMYPTERVR